MADRLGSVGFDRAADYYDRTRGFSPNAFESLMGVLVRELEGRGRCLEIGVGTGLLALPLAERGIPMVGADLAQPMLEKLVEKSGGAAPFPLVQADATALPFRAGALGCAVFRHVLHLIPGWRTVLEELVRVLRAGGRLVIVEGTFHEGAWWDVVSRFLEETRKRAVDAVRAWAPGRLGSLDEPVTPEFRARRPPLRPPLSGGASTVGILFDIRRGVPGSR
jgi:ubiquinone/menaquinone biosynthesis C-methylase UbiE